MSTSKVTTDLESFGWSSRFLHDAEPQLLALKKYAERKFAEGQFLPAGIGPSATKKNQIRGDQIAWLSDSHDSETQFLRNLLAEMQNNLGQYFRCHLERFEGHFSYYPPGSRYAAHLDRSAQSGAGSQDRVFSIIIYLNDQWKKNDGGELRLFVDNRSIDLEPRLGHLVVFRSDTILHEVLETKAGRWAISGWFRRK